MAQLDLAGKENGLGDHLRSHEQHGLGCAGCRWMQDGGTRKAQRGKSGPSQWHPGWDEDMDTGILASLRVTIS